MKPTMTPIIESVTAVKNKPEVKEYIAPDNSADTLFTFMTELAFLIKTIKNKCISPRYCKEDIEYLMIEGIFSVAFPMKCFCDINLHKMRNHLDWYGGYGIAFSKEWGLKNGIQPLQYINPNSKLRIDYSESFNVAIGADLLEKPFDVLKNMLLHELMYLKPYSGPMNHKTTNEIREKCFTDECEWRYVPDVSNLNMPQAIIDIRQQDSTVLNRLSDALDGKKECSLPFEFDDIKYIILLNNSDFYKFLREIKSMKLVQNVRDKLISKIIIWNDSKGDF